MNNKKKFLLVHPEISRTKYNFAGVIDNEPLELEYISAMLKEYGYLVEIWDGQVEKTSLKQKLKEYMPHYLYVCGRTRQENFMKEYCQEAKKLSSSIVTIVGGIHVQFNYKRFYTDYVDYILTTFDIFKLLDIIQEKTLSAIDGICYKQNGSWLKNNDCVCEIQKLPQPDRTYFYEHTDRYRYLELLPCAHVRTSYSCLGSCTFCYRHRLNGGVYTSRDIEDVVHEIKNINCDNIYIIDDDFLVDPKRIRQFTRLIKENNIHKKYVCYGRADFIVHNEELIKELKEIGFYYILVGIEAIEEQYLKSYNKRSHVDDNALAIKILNEAGINMMGMFIVDLSYAVRDFRNLYRWIKKHQLKHTAISLFTPELSSDLYESYKDRIISDNPEHWDYLHLVAKPEKLSIQAYYFHYHILLIKLFLRGKRQGIYDFMDYGYYIKSMIKNIFRFGGEL